MTNKRIRKKHAPGYQRRRRALCRVAPLPVFSFTLVLQDVCEASDEIVERLYSAGCDDGLVGSRDGRAFIAFDREAASLEAAVNSAIADVRSAGLHAHLMN